MKKDHGMLGILVLNIIFVVTGLHCSLNLLGDESSSLANNVKRLVTAKQVLKCET